MESLDYVILIFAVVLGAVIAFAVPKKSIQKQLALFLTFSGSYLFALVFFHLLPMVFVEHDHFIGFWILGGFLLQLFLDQFSKGVEHGHIHELHGRIMQTAVVVTIGLCLHAFLEGLPLGLLAEENVNLAGHQHVHEHAYQHFFWGILIHKLPAAFAFTLVLLISGMQRSRIILFVFLFAIMSPLGALIGQSTPLILNYSTEIMALVIGSLLHISTTILYELDNENQHSVSFKKILVILVGFAVASLSIV